MIKRRYFGVKRWEEGKKTNHPETIGRGTLGGLSKHIRTSERPFPFH